MLGGEHRTRYETMDGRFRAGEAGRDQQLALRTRLFFGIQNIFDPVRFTVALQDSRASLTDSGSFVSSNHVNQTDIQQLPIDFVSDNLLGTGLPAELNIGRVNVDLGRGRWIARNNLRNATNAYDVAHWSLGEPNRWHLHSFVVWPVEQFRRKADRVFTENPTTLWGAYVQLSPLEGFHTELSYHGHASRREARDFTMHGARIFKLGGWANSSLNSRRTTRSAISRRPWASVIFTMENSAARPTCLGRPSYCSNAIMPATGSTSFTGGARSSCCRRVFSEPFSAAM